MGKTITARDKAITGQALNQLPDLSPAARRLGIELRDRADNRTGKAWPSEARLAEALGYNVRTIRRAKAELKAKGLLTWQCRGRHRTPVYTLAWEALKAIAHRLKAKIRDACAAARRRLRTTPTNISSAPADVSKTQNNGPRASQGRTFSPAYLTQNLNISTRSGFWKAPGTPRGQFLTDQQLDARASARFYTALQQLGADIMAQIIAHPDATELEAKAIKAERYQPGTGLDMLKAALIGRTTA